MIPADIDFVATNHASPQASLFWGVLVLLFGGGTTVFSLFYFAHMLVKRGEAEARSAGSASDLTLGPNKIVRGKVAPEGSEAVAVRVEVKQTAKNHTSKNSRWHTWEETGRRTQSRPFYLVQEGAETVMVEPGQDVFVIDEMQITHANCERMDRLRYCDVEAGETFAAYGTLARGPHPRATGAYRDGGAGLILKPPTSGRMYLASGSIKDRYVERVKYMRVWGTIATAVYLAFHLTFTVPFLATSLFGVSEPARVVAHRTWVTHNKNSSTTHYAVTVVTTGGLSFEREVAYSTYDTLIRYENTEARVPTVHFQEMPYASFLGYRPTMNGVAIGVAIGGCLIAVIIFLASYKGKYAWYDREKLSEHGGTGHYLGG